MIFQDVTRDPDHKVTVKRDGTVEYAVPMMGRGWERFEIGDVCRIGTVWHARAYQDGGDDIEKKDRCLTRREAVEWVLQHSGFLVGSAS